MKQLLKRIFSKDTDRRVDYIFSKQIQQPLRDTAKTAKKIRDLLEADGVTLQIYIAGGGDRK